MAINNDTGWGEDFNQFYSASRLAGTGHMYDWDALRRIESENGKEVPTGRLPVVMFGAKVIGWLPYPVARIVWLIASIAALVLCVLAWPGINRPMMALALAWSMPAGLLLVLGQDTPFWLFFVAAALLLMQKGHPRIAGVVLALCICKFHLTVGIAVLLVAQKRWSTLLSAAAAGAALLAACFLIEGPQWPLQYLEAYRQPSFSPGASRMPNLFGIGYWFPWPAAVEVVLAIAVIGLLWMVCRRTPELGMAGAAATAAGLLLAHHCYANDCALSIPLVVFTMQRGNTPWWLKASAVLVLTPAATFLLTSSKPFLGQLLVAGFAIAAFAVEARFPATPLLAARPQR